MKNDHDINIIIGDGYLIIPISMARITRDQKPEDVYKILDYFIKKIHTFSNDVIFLYTTGLYFNSENLKPDKRLKMNQQTIEHSLKLRKIIQQKKQYIPKAFHFLPIEYIILNSSCYQEYFQKLRALAKEDKNFQNALKKDIGTREYNDPNKNFIIEEVVVSHILREGLVELPKTLIKTEDWRLIVYPGNYLESDVYQCKNKILPKSKNKNIFRNAQYDFNQKKIFLFDEL